jgi:hypothetical protein
VTSGVVSRFLSRIVSRASSVSILRSTAYASLRQRRRMSCTLCFAAKWLAPLRRRREIFTTNSFSRTRAAIAASTPIDCPRSRLRERSCVAKKASRSVAMAWKVCGAVAGECPWCGRICVLLRLRLKEGERSGALAASSLIENDTYIRN